MAKHSDTKLQQMMSSFPRGIVLTTKFLGSNNFDRKLLAYYKSSRWLESFGDGAYRRRGDNVDWRGALYAMQEQRKLFIHCGARTALELQGYGHYGEHRPRALYLFGAPGRRLPRWFERYDWGVRVIYKMSRLFPDGLPESFVHVPVGDFTIRISSPERAAMEMLYHIPSEQGFDEAERIMESLLTLRPTLVQELLEVCNSVKVKRLFMYMTAKNNLPWMKELDSGSMNLGKGDRTVIKGGRLDPQYRITVPRNEAG